MTDTNQTMVTLKELLAARVKDQEGKLGIWGVAIQIALTENSNFELLVTSLVSQYEDSPGIMEQIVGKEAAQILWQLSLTPNTQTK